MGFTKSQDTAASIRDKDVIVAAGAGSGKTTVLAERVVRRIKDGASISDFLISTFTVASAADLKIKIGNQISNLIANEPTNKHYRRQQILLNTASIGTIASLCLKQVQQSAAVLNIPAESRICDDAMAEALLKECAERALDMLCEEDSETARLLLKQFASFKSDSALIKTAYELYPKIRSYPFYKDWMDAQVKKCFNDVALIESNRYFDSDDGKTVRSLLMKLIAEARLAIASVQSIAETDIESNFADTVLGYIDGFDAGLKVSFESFCDFVSIKRQSKPIKTSKEFTACYGSFKASYIDNIVKYKRGKEELKEEYRRIAVLTEALCKYLTLIDKLYTEEKRRRALLDFADSEQLFFTLIAEKSEDAYIKTSVGRQLSARYTDVFIDEYQDISPLQDAIFKVIGEGKRFMVGDAKQSIYGFRNAYPDLFMSYRDSFADADSNGTNARVFLNENFRCDKSIIDFANLVFDKTYTVRTADTDYTTERLVMGKDKEKDKGSKVLVTVFENRDTDSYEESEYIAEQILKLRQSGSQYSEMAVLYRSVTGVNKLTDTLRRYGIPYSHIDTKEQLFSTPEVLLATALLRTVDNPTEDIALAAVLRSPLFGFTAEELFVIRSFGETLYADICSYAEGKKYSLKKTKLEKTVFVEKPKVKRPKNPALAAKCRLFIKKLNEYRSKSLIMPVHELLMYMYEDLHFFAFATEGKEDAYMANLYSFYTLAKSAEEHSYKGLSVFMDYIARLKESDASPKTPPSTAGEAVSLLTIHKSKGLEFDTVFLYGLGRRKQKGDRINTAVDYKGGISFDLATESKGGKSKTLHKEALRYIKARATTAEELRLLYVAFTRARNNLIITVSGERTLEDFEKYSSDNYVTVADIFMHALLDGGSCFELKVLHEDEPFCFDFTPVGESVTEEALELPTLYDIESRVEVTAKYFVSATHRDEDGLFTLSDRELMTDRAPSFAADADTAGYAAIGTANHAFMQFADFDNAKADIKAEAKRLLDKQFITEEQYGMLRFDSLCAFFESDIYARLKASRRVYRERRFSTQLDAKLFTGKAGEKVLLQGVIDCFFENGDGSYTLLDYKTDRIKAGEEAKLIERHGTQILLYCMYIEKLTGKPVRDAYIYSFALNKTIKCEEIRI